MVTVALLGLSGVGRRTIADMLVSIYDYNVITLASDQDQDHDISLSTITINESDKHDKRAFKDYEAVCDHVTANWQQHFVIPVIQDACGFLASSLMKRPFVVCVWVTAPMSRRMPEPADDLLLYTGNMPLCKFIPNMDIYLVNNGTIDQLRLQLQQQMSPTRLSSISRPGWDAYFMSLARLAERRSNCMKRRVGAVLVLHNRVLSTGYNGTPRALPNCSSGGCPRCNHHPAKCGQHLDQCLCMHAEENAVVEAGRQRAEGATLYCTTRPCLGCAKQAVQVGVRRVVWEREYAREHDSERLFREAGVVCEQFCEPSRTIICSFP